MFAAVVCFGVCLSLCFLEQRFCVTEVDNLAPSVLAVCIFVSVIVTVLVVACCCLLLPQGEVDAHNANTLKLTADRELLSKERDRLVQERDKLRDEINKISEEMLKVSCS